MVAPSEYKDRFEMAMRQAGKDARDIAKDLGVSYQAVMKVLAGTTKMLKADNNSVAAKAMGVDADWLATGNGEAARSAAWPFRRLAAQDWLALDDYDRVLVEDAAAAKMRELLAQRRMDPPPTPQNATAADNANSGGRVLTQRQQQSAAVNQKKGAA